MGKLELNKKRKKSALYNTAFELFTTKGLAKTTISDIVENAGVAKGTFYLYFKDKYDIRNKLISHKAGELFSEAHDALEASHITGFTAQLHFIVDNILDRLETESNLAGFVSKNCPGEFLRMRFRNRQMTMIFHFSRNISIFWINLMYSMIPQSCFFLPLLNW